MWGCRSLSIHHKKKKKKEEVEAFRDPLPKLILIVIKHNISTRSVNEKK
jgi:hypothetical protein